jgi:hypothetical protein
MFSRTAISVVLALFLAGQVFSSPLPMPLRHILAARQPGPLPLETIPIYIKRAAAEAPPKKRVLPAEVAVKAPDGIIVPYKRSAAGEALPIRREIPAEVATKAPDGIIVPYKREVPVEVAVKAPDGVIVPYKRSASPDDLPLARRYNRFSGGRRQIPAEVPTKSPNGVIVPYWSAGRLDQLKVTLMDWLSDFLLKLENTGCFRIHRWRDVRVSLFFFFFLKDFFALFGSVDRIFTFVLLFTNSTRASMTGGCV